MEVSKLRYEVSKELTDVTSSSMGSCRFHPAIDTQLTEIGLVGWIHTDADREVLKKVKSSILLIRSEIVNEWN